MDKINDAGKAAIKKAYQAVAKEVKTENQLRLEDLLVCEMKLKAEYKARLAELHRLIQECVIAEQEENAVEYSEEFLAELLK